MIYLDNASTSFPKPISVTKGILKLLSDCGGSALRTTSTENEDTVFATRKLISRYFNTGFPNNIIFTNNATESLNTIIYGILEESDHIITSVTEHNSVIRPLRYLYKQKKISISWLECDSKGQVQSDKFKNMITPKTKLVIINHGSNVTGVIQDVEKIGNILKEYPTIYFLLDISQTAGHIEIDNQKIGADFLAFTGHKGLLGVTGIGGFYINPIINIKPLKRGGTGVLSELLDQPKSSPLFYEAGTLDMVGIVSLYHSISYLIENSEDQESELEAKVKYVIDELAKIEFIEIYSKVNPIGIISFNVVELAPARVAYLLLQKNIKSRSGLLCAPLIHRYLHDRPFGCIRVSLSRETKYTEIAEFIKAMKEISRELETIKNIKMPKTASLPSLEDFYKGEK